MSPVQFVPVFTGGKIRPGLFLPPRLRMGSSYKSSSPLPARACHGVTFPFTVFFIRLLWKRNTCVVLWWRVFFCETLH